MTRSLAALLLLTLACSGQRDPCEVEALDQAEVVGTLPLSGANPRIGTFVPHPDGGGAFPVLTDEINAEESLIRIDAQGVPVWTVGRPTDPFYKLDQPPHAAWGPSGWLLGWTRDDDAAQLVRIDDEGQDTELAPLPWGGEHMGLGWTGSSFLVAQDGLDHSTRMHVLDADGSVLQGPIDPEGYNLGWIRTMIGGDESAAIFGDGAITFVDAQGAKLGHLVADRTHGLYAAHAAPEGQGWRTAHITTVDHARDNGLAVWSWNGGAIVHQRLDAQTEPVEDPRVEPMLGEGVWPTLVMLSRDGTAAVFLDEQDRLGAYDVSDLSERGEACRVRMDAPGVPFDAVRDGHTLTVWLRSGRELLRWTADLSRQTLDEG